MRRGKTRTLARMATAPGSIREAINRAKRLWVSVALVAFAICAVSLLVATPDAFPWMFFVGMALGILAVVGINLWIRCPKCQGSIGPLAFSSGNPFAISKDIRYCPYCATNFDNQ